MQKKKINNFFFEDWNKSSNVQKFIIFLKSCMKQ